MAQLRADRRDVAARDRLIQRLQFEFEEMPGLRLSAQQAARLLGTRPEACERMLASLAENGILDGDGNGVFVRRSSRS